DFKKLLIQRYGLSFGALGIGPWKPDGRNVALGQRRDLRSIFQPQPYVKLSISIGPHRFRTILRSGFIARYQIIFFRYEAVRSKYSRRGGALSGSGERLSHGAISCGGSGGSPRLSL